MTSTNSVISAPPSTTITLRTGDGKVFDVEESIAMEFIKVKTFLEDYGDGKAGTVVPLPKVAAKYLTLIIDYCKEQKRIQEESTPLAAKKAFERIFVDNLETEDMKQMLLVANYLNIKSFYDTICQAVADRISNWSVEKCRDFFGVENDLTEEEEARHRQDYSWAYENVEN